MFHAIIWLVVGSLVAVWSLLAWATQAVVTWTLTHAGGLAGGSAALAAVRWPDWLAPLIPSEWAPALTALATALGPMVEALIGWAPALGGVLAVAVWVGWALGTGLLLVMGIGASVLVAWMRGRGAGGGVGPTLSGVPRFVSQYLGKRR